MFFASTQGPGGFGGPDLYQSYRADIHDDFAWQTPTNLGPGVNTAKPPRTGSKPTPTTEGTTRQIYFGSDRLGPAGNASLYVSNLQADGTWGPATQVTELGAGNRPSLRLDGLEIFFLLNPRRRRRVGGSTSGPPPETTLDAAPWSTLRSTSVRP